MNNPVYTKFDRPIDSYMHYHGLSGDIYIWKVNYL